MSLKNESNIKLRSITLTGTDITSLSNADALKLYNKAMKDDVIKIKRTRSHSFLKDKIEIQQQNTETTTTVEGLDITDKVLKESKEAPRPVPKMRDDGEPPREAAIEAPSSMIAVAAPSKDVKWHVFSIELVKGKISLFAICYCCL